jgi:acyl-CoA synthetase (AMP-forming)/AMP-acid ligase II
MESAESRAARHRALEAEPLPANMATVVEAAAERFGDAPVLVFFEAGRTLSFKELRDETLRAANALAGAGVTKGDRVATMLPNIPAYPIIWLALAQIGAIMVPVNNRYTARELEYLLNDAEVGHFVTHTDYLTILDGVANRPEGLTDDRVLVAGAPDPRYAECWDALVAAAPASFEPESPIALDDLIGIQYTSGTTGFPKGCMLSHRYWIMSGRVANFITDFAPRRILMAQHFYYLDPMLFLMMCLEGGGAMYFCSRPSTSRFMTWVRDLGIDYCLAFEFVYKQPESPCDAENVLEAVWLSGLTKEIHADFERRFATTAREVHGMTETGPNLYVPFDHVHMVGSGSCGIPAPYRQARIMGEDGREVSVGVVGELWVAGPGLMQGYYNKPEANSEALTDGWFHTGDLFRRDEAGYHYIVGRIKDMVRRSGENIAAREVEAVLRLMPEIEEAAVVPVPDPTSGEEVKAYVSLMPGFERAGVPPEKILAHCAEHLARFKVPRYIAYRDAFPMTVSARVEKKRVMAETDDLRADSYDRVDGVWR